jgi:hypothetical protein
LFCFGAYYNTRWVLVQHVIFCFFCVFVLFLVCVLSVEKDARKIHMLVGIFAVSEYIVMSDSLAYLELPVVNRYEITSFLNYLMSFLVFRRVRTMM